MSHKVIYPFKVIESYTEVPETNRVTGLTGAANASVTNSLININKHYIINAIVKVNDFIAISYPKDEIAFYAINKVPE